MKCWLLAPNENWIVDEMVKQFMTDNPDICTDNIDEADIVWVLADWCFDRIPMRYLASGKPIVVMLHHFVPEKFDRLAEATFIRHDRYVTAYTAPNFRTRDFVLERKLTNKTIHVVPYWVHSKSWKKTGNKLELRRKYGIPETAYIAGSFQRDTEGHDLKSPKLEKGPDLLADALAALHRSTSNFHVILGGWRRQYVIGRLEAAHVPYTYFELPSQEIVNELYQMLDIYIVASRYEGGPQAYGEAGALGVPVVSRPVGMAECVLPESAINDDLCLAKPSVPNVEHLKTPFGYIKHIEVLKDAIK